MFSRIAAGVVAGLLALTAAPAVAQVKDERKADEADAVKKLEAEIARLRAMEEELHAKLKHLRMDLDRKGAIERIEKSQIERQIEDVKKQAELEKQRAQAEFDRALKLRDEQLKRAQIEFDRAARLPGERGKLAEEIEKSQRLGDEKAKLAQIEREKVIRLRDEESKLSRLDQERLARLQEERARLIQREIDKAIELKASGEKPKVLVLGAGDKAPVAYDKMSAEEIKQLITKLQILLEQKTRSGDKPGVEKVKPGVEKVKPAYPDKSAFGEKVKPGSVSQDEILKRLDKLTHEVEELKRSIKK